MSKLYINRKVEIKNNSVFVDDKLFFDSNEEDSFSVFAKQLFKSIDGKYRKFYKMDLLSKLGYLATEILLKDYNTEGISPHEKSIILANASASLQTDIAFQETIKETPSPAIFVYTLPNIVIGEICIRHDIKGETTFFVQDEYDTSFFFNYITDIFATTPVQMCITGWVEVSENEDYNAKLMLVTRNEGDLTFEIENIK
jgi:hypothetical protein